MSKNIYEKQIREAGPSEGVCVTLKDVANPRAFVNDFDGKSVTEFSYKINFNGDDSMYLMAKDFLHRTIKASGVANGDTVRICASARPNGEKGTLWTVVGPDGNMTTSENLPYEAPAATPPPVSGAPAAPTNTQAKPAGSVREDLQNANKLFGKCKQVAMTHFQGEEAVYKATYTFFQLMLDKGHSGWSEEEPTPKQAPRHAEPAPVAQPAQPPQPAQPAPPAAPPAGSDMSPSQQPWAATDEDDLPF